jgi:hypothetical protein
MFGADAVFTPPLPNAAFLKAGLEESAMGSLSL